MSLNGVALLRYAHAFASGGGMEQHLHDLDRTLLSRNRMTIVRVFLGSAGSSLTKETSSCGQGQLVKIAVPLPVDESWTTLAHGEGVEAKVRAVFRDHILCATPMWQLFGRRYALRRPVRRRPGEPIGVGAVVSSVLDEYRIQLIMLHFMGGSDSEEVLLAAQRRGVPCAVQNHFSNDRFNHLSIRKHVEMADAVAGINALGVPGYLRHRFQNLSNGIDTEFFQRIPCASAGMPRILLPARIVREKGQLDLLHACRLLKKSGMEFHAVFAGRVDSEAFLEELEREVAQLGLVEQVSMPGVLNQSQLRDEYARSTIVAFPTRHHEGLGRVVIEAQAMSLPVVAYNTGGVAEGMLPGKTGYLVKVGDIAGIALRLRELLENARLRDAMGKAGRKFVEDRFSLPALAERHEVFYRSLVKAPISPITTS